ncbi:MAG TPA: chromate transporter [Holophagaceae bacterium]|nr:chromate transporter [Holophagaceae bacterium]
MSPLREVVLLFLRLGFTAFGGPVAHLALMEREVVQKRAWLTREAFLDLIGLTQLIPGPNSTEMAIHLGKLRAGTPGLILGGLAFILPAAGMVGGLAWAYVRFGTRPAAVGWLYGLKPALLMVVVQALVLFGKALLTDRLRWAVALLALGAVALGAPELGILLGAGLLLMGVREGWPRGLPALAWLPAVGSTGGVFLSFLKIGSVLYGSGYVLLAFLRAEFVVRHGLISERQLLDAVAVGQFTPGPVFTTATFVGYLIQGWKGAVLATAGIFLPSFVFVALSGRLLRRLQASPRARAFLDGVNAASLALMAAVLLPLGRAALVDGRTLLLALAGGGLLWRTKLNPTWILLGSGLLGWALHAAG